MEKLKNIRLRSKEDRRFKQGHPWVYSNELQESPKGIEAGELVELHDAGGDFLAYGFGNPNSLIAFRALSREKIEGNQPKSAILSPEFFAKKIEHAFAFRSSFFSKNQSFRLVYGEVDGLPGLIIDRFYGHTQAESAAGEKYCIYVIQPHSYGMDRHLEIITRALAKESKAMGDSAKSLVVLRRDAGSREREGLSKEATEIKNLQSLEGLKSYDDYREFWFSVPGGMESEVKLKTDLVAGQKTGFFFDQLQNVNLTQSLLLRKLRLDREKRARLNYRILDLCSYIGQWSTHLTQTFIRSECLPLEVTCVDASEGALKFAEQNVAHEAKRHASEQKVTVKKLKADVLEPMPSLEDRGYDVVIADPPAFIKNRKSIPQGKHAYVNLFTTAIQKTAKGGLAVFCSCSQLLSSEDMVECLSKAARRSGRRVRFIAQGSPSVDHFMQFEFNEGHYLKCWIAQID